MKVPVGSKETSNDGPCDLQDVGRGRPKSSLSGVSVVRVPEGKGYFPGVGSTGENVGHRVEDNSSKNRFYSNDNERFDGEP